MKKERRWETPEPSTASVSGFVLLVANGRDLELRFDFDRDGIALTSGLRFTKVRAYRHRQELYETEWHISSAYDTLVEVLPSDWVNELRSAAPPDQRNAWTMKHFMITLDSAGCFEVVAEGWEALPETEGTLSRHRLTVESI